RDCILPGPDRRVPIVSGFDRIDRADGAGLDQLADLLVDQGAGVLAANLENRPGFLLRGDHLGSLGDLPDHRLLAVNRLAGLHRVDRDPRMPVVGHADQDGIDVRACQDLAVIDVRADPVAEDLPGMDAPALIEVRDRNQLGSRYLERCLGVNEPDDAHADGCDPDPIVRASRPRLRQLLHPTELEGVAAAGGRHDRGQGGCQGRRLEERPTRALRVLDGVILDVLLSRHELLSRSRNRGPGRPGLVVPAYKIRTRHEHWKRLPRSWKSRARSASPKALARSRWHMREEGRPVRGPGRRQSSSPSPARPVRPRLLEVPPGNCTCSFEHCVGGSSGSAALAARRTGYSILRPAEGQHATTCYVFRFLAEVWRTMFRRKLM